MNRPRGVTVIVVFCFLLAVVCAVLGTSIIIGVNSIVSAIHRQNPAANVAALGSVGVEGIALLMAAVVEAVLGRGLWKLKNWARITAIVLSALSLISVFRDLLTGDVAHMSTLIFRSTMFSLGVNALIIWYLLQPDVSAAFHSSEAGS